MDIKQLLEVEILPTLTDFRNNQIVFWNRFEELKNAGTPILNVLELGVYRLPGDEESHLPGQSTKTLMALSGPYGVRRHISLDIDDCRKTIERCKKWLAQRGFEAHNHEFVQSNSIHLDVKAHFPDGVDFIFLDTNHDDIYPETLGYKDSGGKGMTFKEISHYAPHLSAHGSLFLHDTKNFYAGKEYGVNTAGAVERFINENPDFYFTEHNTNVHGLGEIRRK